MTQQGVQPLAYAVLSYAGPVVAVRAGFVAGSYVELTTGAEWTIELAQVLSPGDVVDATEIGADEVEPPFGRLVVTYPANPPGATTTILRLRRMRTDGFGLQPGPAANSAVLTVVRFNIGP